MTRFQLCIVAVSSHKLRPFALIPSPTPTGSLDWSILQDRSGRSRSSATSGVGSGQRGWSSLCLSTFSLFFLGWPTSALLFLSIQRPTKSCLRPFILFYFDEIWSSLFRLKSTHCRRWMSPTPTYEDTGTFNHSQRAQAAWCKGQEFASVVRRPYKMCAYSNDDHSKMTTSSSV